MRGLSTRAADAQGDLEVDLLRILGDPRFMREEWVRERGYEFTTPWHQILFDNQWRDRLKEFVGKPEVRYLELGAFEGASLFWMFDHVLTHPTSRAIVIDYFQGAAAERFNKNLAASGKKGQMLIHQGSTESILPSLDPYSFDLIYVDADHSCRGVLSDAVMSWRLLKNGGVMVFDDYLWGIDQFPERLRPKPAVDFFVSSFSQDCDVIWSDYQLAIRKNERPKPTSMMSSIGDYTYFWFDRRLEFKGQELQLDEKAIAALETVMRMEKTCTVADIDACL